MALEKVSQPHPLSVKIAVASLKKYIVDDGSKISLHDLVMNETERVYTEIIGPNCCTVGEPITPQNVLNKIKKYEAVVEILLGLFASGCYWGDTRHESLWVKSLAARGRSPIFTKRTESVRSGDLGSQIVSDRVLGTDERSRGRAVAPTEQNRKPIRQPNGPAGRVAFQYPSTCASTTPDCRPPHARAAV